MLILTDMPARFARGDPIHLLDIAQSDEGENVRSSVQADVDRRTPAAAESSAHPASRVPLVVSVSSSSVPAWTWRPIRRASSVKSRRTPAARPGQADFPHAARDEAIRQQRRFPQAQNLTTGQELHLSDMQ